MTKEEKIREAYGEHWKFFNGSAKQCALNNNGWINPILEHAPNNLDLERGEKFIYRPKSLQGIENNNGWIKIESEYDLPKESIDCHYRLFVSETYSNAGEYILSGRFRVKSSLTNSTNFFTCDDMIRSYFPRVTHYQPIQKPQPPIY